MYTLVWKNPAIVGKTAITVPVASTVTTATSLVLTGKGAANYGKAQQENLLRLLENFADSTAPLYPTVGQIWYDSASEVLKLCTSTVPVTWRTLGTVSFTAPGDPPPLSPVTGDLWLERTGNNSAVLYVYTGLGRHPAGASNGGWNQIWPQVEADGVRYEYDAIREAVGRLIDDPATTGGNGAVGKYITNLTNFAALDAHLLTEFSSDSNVAVPVTAPQLEAQPYSHDWDKLLAAAKWAVSRLDLPSAAVDSISAIPFIQDGRQAPADLLALPANDVRYPSLQRRMSRKFGSITMFGAYTETANTLQLAEENRYSLRGIAGNSSTVTSFSPDVVSQLHCVRSGNWTGGTAFINTTFNFASTAARDAFIYGGNAIEVEVVYTHGPSPTAADTAFRAFLEGGNTFFRVTADKTRSFGNVVPLVMSAAPSSIGLINALSSTSTLMSKTSGANEVMLTGSASSTSFNIDVRLQSSAGLTGVATVNLRVIRDRTTYGPSNISLFPHPNAYVAASDATGTSAPFVNVSFTSAPVANFTSSTTSVAVGGAVSFTWTGTGAPSLIEWDFDGNGTYTATGTSASTTYPVAGAYTVRARASNSAGSDVMTKVGYIVVT